MLIIYSGSRATSTVIPVDCAKRTRIRVVTVFASVFFMAVTGKRIPAQSIPGNTTIHLKTRMIEEFDDIHPHIIIGVLRINWEHCKVLICMHCSKHCNIPITALATIRISWQDTLCKHHK